MAKQISEIVEEIRRLAQKNKIKELVKLLSDLAYKYEKNPRRLIAVITLRIYYNIQLNASQNVVADFNLIKSPYSDKWLYESYPDKYGDRRGTMCPFSLYWMYCYYPYVMGSMYTALDRFYSLREYLEHQLSENPQQSEVYDSRIVCVGLLLIDILMSEKRLTDALTELLSMQRAHSKMSHVINAMIALVYTQIGDITNAQKHIENAIEAGSKITEIYRGLRSALLGDFDNAYSIFNATLPLFKDEEPSSVVTACENLVLNNIAVTLFYMNNAAAGKVIIDSCKNVHKTAKIFRAVTMNTTMLKELAMDIDTKAVQVPGETPK
uniref:Uncharacterized protein n=1 Tax=Babesia bovis TaxID=5865 RepID=S6B2B1_BABBO|nr:hypothetical protein [Babesia bovis]